jgi:hypothetical protein
MAAPSNFSQPRMWRISAGVTRFKAVCEFTLSEFKLVRRRIIAGRATFAMSEPAEPPQDGTHLTMIFRERTLWTCPADSLQRVARFPEGSSSCSPG